MVVAARVCHLLSDTSKHLCVKGQTVKTTSSDYLVAKYMHHVVTKEQCMFIWMQLRSKLAQAAHLTGKVLSYIVCVYMDIVFYNYTGDRVHFDRIFIFGWKNID